MTRWTVVLVALFLLGYGSAGVLTAQSATPSGPKVVNVHDYALCNGTTDDTVGVQNAVNNWMWAFRPGIITPDRTTVLDFGSGNCLISKTIRFYRADWTPRAYGGIIRGDGPEAMTIRSSCCFRAFEFKQFQHGMISGLKFSGGPAKSNDNNHAGIALGNYGPGLGSFGNLIENVTFEHFGAALVLGDQDNSGSAADSTFINVGASQNHIGVYVVTFNSLDLRFQNLMLTENDLGVYSDSAYGFEFSGAGTNNGTTFYFRQCCEVNIHSWREELSTKSAYWVQYGGPTETRLTLDSVQVIDTLGRQMGEVVHLFPGSNGALTMRGSFLNGNVSANKYVGIQGSAIAAARPYVGTPTNVFISGVCQADRTNGQCVGDFPLENR